MAGVSLMLNVIGVLKPARVVPSATEAAVLAVTPKGALLNTASVLATRLAAVSAMLQGVERPERVVACSSVGTLLTTFVALPRKASVLAIRFAGVSLMV